MASRVLGALAVTATAALATLAMAAPASAHTPVSSADCVKDKAVLSVLLTQYAGGNKNTVLIKDGETVLVDEKFSENYGVKVDGKWKPKTFEADGTIDHTFTIEVKASDTKPGGKNYDYSKTHTVKKCVTTPPSESTKPSEPTKPPVQTTTEAPSSSVTPPAPGGSTPEPPLAATGASPMWLLLSGLGLVGAGAGTLLFLRRRRSA
ncbi:LPXTG cell wall anchor domain-containing protein [Lentzea sp. NPDC051838]|uniref:LPXTG cell wall anchor domain-containing protein n=1 Tax=Lentzea sp. NPDC051838 TaxID=3154849 RepID=UPI003448C566